jgi:hypothetical protein
MAAGGSLYCLPVQLRGEVVCTIAAVLAPMEATHRAQREGDLKKPSQGLLARSLGDVIPRLPCIEQIHHR